ncbi:MAG: hypothetical protein LBU46_03215 [Candidatus Accumulibacter sp.]|nr:hypothetical protein [Accumulibacter sp.]
MLGVCERSFRRYLVRYEADGLEVTVYGLEIEDYHSFYAGIGIWAHDAGPVRKNKGVSII